MGIKINEELLIIVTILVCHQHKAQDIFLFSVIFQDHQGIEQLLLGAYSHKKEFPYCCKTLDISTVTIVSI